MENDVSDGQADEQNSADVAFFWVNSGYLCDLFTFPYYKNKFVKILPFDFMGIEPE